MRQSPWWRYVCFATKSKKMQKRMQVCLLYTSEWGKVRQSVDLYHGIAKGWANAEHAWWFPELPAPTHGCMLSNIECIWDPHGQDKFISSHHMRGVPVKIYKATPENCPDGKVIPLSLIHI